MKRDDCLKEASKILSPKVADRSLHEARLLLAYVLKLDPVQLILEPSVKVDEALVGEFFSLVERRLRSEPMAYLLGRKEFYGFEFEVNPDVLIPRPETESLVEACIRWLEKRDPWRPRILELGVGSGCILISLSLLRKPKEAEYTGIDISKKALETARQNQIRLQAPAIEWIEGDMGYNNKDCGPFDLIVSNPPYIRSADWDNLAEDIRMYEPKRALEAGEDGMLYFRMIIENWYSKLEKGGLLALETYDEMQREQIRQEYLQSLKADFWIQDCHIFIEKKD